ncbi:MAG TPA: MFS transporter [Clostridiales bacterium]|nr:MFS transporter [Clostridiales bacterium]
MKLKVYSLIFFLNAYLSGLLVPVLSLLLLEKGANISNLSIILGLYAFTVVALELPTGIIADVFGRKSSFCLSIVISIMSLITFLTGKGFMFLCIGIMLYGLSRALSSGSFEAMFIDYYIDNYGKDKLHNITTRLGVLEALGMSAGALSGGYFPEISNTYFASLGTYDLNIIIRIALAAIVAILSFAFIQEDKIHSKEERITLKQHIINSSEIVTKNSTVICIFISVFSTGFFLSSLETYWQPHFITLLPSENSMKLLGLMAFLYFASATLGSIASNKIIKKYKFSSANMYIVIRALLSVAIVVTALQTNVPVFMSSYAIIYLFFGMASVPEGVILNAEIPNNVRASVLSVNSLVLQVGGLSGSLLYSILIRYISIPAIWMLSSSIVLLTVIVISKTLLKKAPSSAINEHTNI